jgi:hypothetical protein
LNDFLNPVFTAQGPQAKPLSTNKKNRRDPGQDAAAVMSHGTSTRGQRAQETGKERRDKGGRSARDVKRAKQQDAKGNNSDNIVEGLRAHQSNQVEFHGITSSGFVLVVFSFS